MVAPVIRVGLIGHGTVGSAFADALHARTDSITQRADVRLVLAQIATRTPGVRSPLPCAARGHGDAATLADDPSIDIVVEASGAGDAAQWIRRALARGASVVNAQGERYAEAELRTSLAGLLTLHGQGAGGRGTAAALRGDTISAARAIARGRLSRIAS